MIPEGLLHLFSRRPLGQWAVDVMDLLLVAWIIYRALLVLRGTRAQQMSIGVLVLAAAYAGAKWAGLITLVNLMDAVLGNLVLILVIVFQNDVRRGLMRLGDKAWLPGFSRAQETKIIDEVVAAATELARHRIGALIAFEQNASLDEFVASHGIAMDSSVSRELLVTIFQSESVNKLHDGAVVIRNLRIAAAGVFFPMPEARNLDASLGSRHRAGLGITDETDAVVVVVSEERGSVTVCYRGNMIQHLDGQKLKAVLLDLMGHKPRASKKSAPKVVPESKRDSTTASAKTVVTPPPRPAAKPEGHGA